LAKIYDESFKPYATLFEPLKQLQDCTYHIYIIKLNLENLSVSRDTIFKALKDNNIGVNVHYLPIYKHSYYKSIGITGNCPIAEDIYERIITLPIYPTLGDEDLKRVIDTVISVVSSYKKYNFLSLFHNK
jgi:dTDP-4-amino-4,6-dideoxygalactose transaminase